MTDEQPRSLWSRLKWIVVAAWVVAGVKFALEFRQHEEAIMFSFGDSRWQAAIGVYYVMPVLMVIGGLKGVFVGLGYGKLVLSMLLLSLLCWFGPNTVVYTTAQFQGWTHGRFAPPPPETPETAETAETKAGDQTAAEQRPARNAPLADSIPGKLWAGLSVAALTAIGGFLWCFIWMNLLIYLPRRLSQKK